MVIDPVQRYQTMTGFGASLTESGAIAISKLSPTARDALMESLFNRDVGIGLSFLRHPMGSSDFRVADYTYNDVAVGGADLTLANFSIRHDTTLFPGTTVSMLDLLKEARTLNPGLHLMGSPWSAPGWMKTGAADNIVPQGGVDQRLYGGTLSSDPAIVQAYANYFVKFVQAFASEGVLFDSISPQNEPFFDGGFAYPAMTLSAPQQAELILKIGKVFETAPVDPDLPLNPVSNPSIASGTKILMLDHNWSLAVNAGAPSTNITTLLDDPEVAVHVEGIAFHGYEGSVAAQTVVHNAYPEKSIHFTEQSGTAGSDFANDLMYDVRTLIVGGTRAWASTIAKFNLALDETNGPKIRTITFDNGEGNQSVADSGFNSGRGLVTIDSASGEIVRNQEFYALAHASKFVQPGARRVASNSSKSVAFTNPDHSLVLIAYNDGAAAVDYRFRWYGKSFDYSLPARSVVTFSWSGTEVNPAISCYLTTGDKLHLLEKQENQSFVGEFTYSGWVQVFFPGEEDPEVTGPLKDPDHDGQSNLFEFALGGAPSDSSNYGKIYLLTADSDDPNVEKELLMTVAVRKKTPVFTGGASKSAVSDFEKITVSGSDDLADFGIPVEVVPPIPPPGAPEAPDDYEYRSFKLVGSDGLPSRGFLRVEVSEAP